MKFKEKSAILAAGIRKFILKYKKRLIIIGIIGVVFVSSVVIYFVSRPITPKCTNSLSSCFILPTNTPDNVNLPSAEDIKGAFANIKNRREYTAAIYDVNYQGTGGSPVKLIVSGDDYIVKSSDSDVKAFKINNRFYLNYGKNQEYYEGKLLKNLGADKFPDNIYENFNQYYNKPHHYAVYNEASQTFIYNNLIPLQTNPAYANLLSVVPTGYVYIRSEATRGSYPNYSLEDMLINANVSDAVNYRFWVFDDNLDLTRFGYLDKNGFFYVEYDAEEESFNENKSKLDLTPKDFCDGKKTILPAQDISLACPENYVITHFSFFDAISQTDIEKKSENPDNPYNPDNPNPAILRIINTPRNLLLKLPDYLYSTYGGEDYYIDNTVPPIDSSIKRTVLINGKEYKYTVYHVVLSNNENSCTKKSTYGCYLRDVRFYTLQLNDSQTIFISQSTAKTYDQNGNITLTEKPSENDFTELENIVKSIKAY